MISKSIPAVGALMLLSATAQAGSAPKELYGKSITVQWSESVAGRRPGEHATENWLNVYLLKMYVSSVGRPFVRRTSSSVGAGRLGFGAGNLTFSGAPGQSSSGVVDHIDFQGRSIFVYRQLVSGAKQISIDLDSAGTGCKATVVNGREAGKNIVTQHQGRGQVEISSIQVGTVICSIQEGNVFGQ
jgi:hypothetical protein